MRKLIASLWLGLVVAAAAAENVIPKHGPLAVGKGDRLISPLVARFLEESHYLQQPFDDKVSSRFLDRYVNLLDPQHLHFLQSDVADFEAFRTHLDESIKDRGDTSAAYAIANVFIDRVEQRMAYCQELLKNDKFDFTAPEKVMIDRKDEPFPKDLDEARRLWRGRLRAEVLQEVIGQIKPTNQVASNSNKIENAVQAKDAKPGDANNPAAIASVASTNKVETPVEIVSRRYNRVLRLYREWDNEDVLEVFLTSLARTYDPHSDYLGKSQLDNFSISMSLSLFGIGARLMSEDGYCTIVDLTDGGPAKRSGKLKPKDRIVAVAQGDGEPADVVNTKLNKVVELIRGPKGSEVRLTVIPVDATDPSTRKIVSLTREEIKLEQEAKSTLMELPGKDGKPVRLGVIDLPSFYATFNVSGRNKTEDGQPETHAKKSTSADVAKLLRKFKEENVQGVVLDLRRNGGGSLEEAVKLTGLFIKEGPVVQVRDANSPPIVDEDTDEGVAWDGPLIVLTSRFSASASEILAGALQDYGRAVIVGDSSTHGKGTVQALYQLDMFVRQFGNQAAQRFTNNPGALKLTIRKFYRASGASTQLKGVVPDVILPSVVDAIDVGEASLDDPLPWDEIKPAKFTPANTATPYLAELKRRSAARVASEKDFAYVHEDYELARKHREEKTVSLNLAERLQEKRDAETRKDARTAERQARAKAPEKDYEITLKIADQPGLPEPIGKTNAVAAASASSAGAASTNAAVNPAPHPVMGAEADDEEADSQVDVPLEEAKRILLDYLSLLASKSGGVAQTVTP